MPTTSTTSVYEEPDLCIMTPIIIAGMKGRLARSQPNSSIQLDRIRVETEKGPQEIHTSWITPESSSECLASSIRDAPRPVYTGPTDSPWQRSLNAEFKLREAYKHDNPYGPVLTPVEAIVHATDVDEDIPEFSMQTERDRKLFGTDFQRLEYSLNSKSTGWGSWETEGHAVREAAAAEVARVKAAKELKAAKAAAAKARALHAVKMRRLNRLRDLRRPVEKEVLTGPRRSARVMKTPAAPRVVAKKATVTKVADRVLEKVTEKEKEKEKAKKPEQNKEISAKSAPTRSSTRLRERSASVSASATHHPPAAATATAPDATTAKPSQLTKVAEEDNIMADVAPIRPAKPAQKATPAKEITTAPSPTKPQEHTLPQTNNKRPAPSDPEQEDGHQIKCARAKRARMQPTSHAGRYDLGSIDRSDIFRGDPKAREKLSIVVRAIGDGEELRFDCPARININRKDGMEAANTWRRALFKYLQ